MAKHKYASISGEFWGKFPKIVELWETMKLYLGKLENVANMWEPEGCIRTFERSRVYARTINLSVEFGAYWEFERN